MADKHWIGADTNYGNTANFSATYGGAGSAGVPGNGDTLYVDYSATNIDGYDASAVTLAAAYITKGYGRPPGSSNPVSGMRIGSAGGTPLKINATNLYIDSDVVDTIILHGTFTNIYVNQIPLNCSLAFQGAGCTNIEAGTNGRITFDNDCGVQRIETRGTQFKLGTYATLPPPLKISASRGSNIESRRRITQANINGMLWMRDEAAIGSVNQVENITFDAPSSGGNLRLTIQKPDGTFATMSNAAWSATDATYLAAINTQLDTASGVVGGIVATAIAGVDTDSGIRLTYSGTGYAGKSWSKASVHTYPTTSTLATYTPVRTPGCEITIGDRGVVQYDGFTAIGQTSDDIIRILNGGLFDASRVVTPIALNAQIIAMGSFKLSSTIVQNAIPRQPGEIVGGVGA